MKVIKPQKLSVVTRAFEHLRKRHFSIGVLALQAFDGALASDADLWTFLAEQLGKDALVDAGMPKSRGEFLVAGDAFQPDGLAHPTATVTAQVGEQRKTLYVIGDRRWVSSSEFTAPVPFVQMPLDWSRAFGGEGFDRNPLGRGFGSNWRDLSLPNIETARSLIAIASDEPEPDGLGPLDISWPQRLSKAGTYDNCWLKQEFPGGARDMHWSVYNIAPEDQQIEAFWRGDERFSVAGMHPDKAFVEGKLSGLAAKCFVTLRRSEPLALQEVPLELTTVWLFPAAERYLLVFHGACEVHTDDASDIRELVLAAELPETQRPTEHYQRVLEQRLDPELGAIAALRDSDLLPDAPHLVNTPDAATAEMFELLQQDDLLKEHGRNFRIDQNASAREEVAAQGLDPDEYVPLLPPEEPTPEVEDLPALMEKADRDLAESKARMEQEKADALRKTREALEGTGIDVEAFIEQMTAGPKGPPSYSVEEELAKLGALRARCDGSGFTAEQLEEMFGEEARQRTVRVGEQTRDGYRQTAHQQEAADRLSGEAAQTARQHLLSHLSVHGKDLHRADLTGMDLSEMDLSGADLRGAWMESADLTNANLAGANLEGAVLARAQLTNTDLRGSQLMRANLGGASLIQTRADESDLEEAILTRCTLDGASLRGVNLKDANLLELHVVSVDLSGARLSGLFFHEIDLRGARFCDADLSEAVFLKCDLSRADATHARLARVTFVETRGRGFLANGTFLERATFVKGCDFSAASFVEAYAPMVNLRGVPLIGAKFTRATLRRSDLSEADLTDATLEGVDAGGALFVRSLMDRARLRSINLSHAVLSGAHLAGADLRGACLFQADLSRAAFDEHTTVDGAYRARVRVDPLRGPERPGEVDA